MALSWCFEDERTPTTKAALERVGEASMTMEPRQRTENTKEKRQCP
jgi:hypothetical protein